MLLTPSPYHQGSKMLAPSGFNGKTSVIMEMTVMEWKIKWKTAGSDVRGSRGCRRCLNSSLGADCRRFLSTVAVLCRLAADSMTSLNGLASSGSSSGIGADNSPPSTHVLNRSLETRSIQPIQSLGLLLKPTPLHKYYEMRLWRPGISGLLWPWHLTSIIWHGLQ